jgi:tetratricopeptide (TPR) repeat protein
VLEFLNGIPLKNLALPLPSAAFRKLLAAILAVLVAFLPARVAAAQTVDTDPLNRDPLVRDAFEHFYNMDYEGSLARFYKVQAAHPADPIATDYILYVTLFRELFRLDLLDTTFYANDGFLTGKHTIVEDPKVRDQIKSLADKAFNQANDELRANPKDVNALFARGWARSLEATYLAMVERSYTAGLKLALGAKNDHDKVLQLDPNYVDAKMVAGIYQYVIGSLPFAFKVIIGFAGIHGSKTGGMAMLQDSAARGVITSVESRTAMSLFLRREAKYSQALAMTRTLVAQYPRDYLFCLEEANLSKDAGEGMKSVDLYRQLVSNVRRPSYFASSHLELAYFGLGDSLRGQHLYQESIDAYRQAGLQPTTSPELKRRCLLAAGEVYDLMDQRDEARHEYQEAIDAGGNTAQADLARKYMESAYKGR